MQTYISLLRGINVSGQKSIKMVDLQEHYNSLGYTNVKTYIQSGNVVFQSKKKSLATLEKEITQKINKEYKFDVPVMVKDMHDIQDAVNKNPFLKRKNIDLTKLHLTFLSGVPDNSLLARISGEKYDDDEFICIENIMPIFPFLLFHKAKIFLWPVPLILIVIGRRL